MSIVTINTPFNIDLEFQVAAFHKRLLAWLIDMLILLVYFIVTAKYVLGAFTADEGVEAFTVYAVILIPICTYNLTLEIILKGQSIGKKVLGIRVIDRSGNEATISQYLLRWVLRLIDFLSTFGAAAVLSAAITPNTQRLGDLVAGTIVIDEKYKTDIHQTIYLEIANENYKPLFPQVMQLTDRDITGIRNLLDVKHSGRETDTYMNQVVNRILEVLKIDTDMESRQFLEQLLWDYNFLTKK